MRGLQGDRAAEVIVSRAGGEERGSGYLVRTGVLLTAAHVVNGATDIQVRFEADREGEWIAPAEVHWADASTDVALLTLRETPGKPHRTVPPARFGTVREADARLACSALGFPLFQLRAYPGGKDFYRDSAHARGDIALLADRKARTFEFRVQPPEGHLDRPHSPWEGMSGAAVWAHGRIIGVITHHQRHAGAGTLTVSRADRWVENLDRAGAAALRHAGLVPPLRKVAPWWRNPRVVSGVAGLAVLAAGGGTWLAVTSPSSPPLKFQVLDTCTHVGQYLDSSSSGFTPGGQYTDEIHAPDGRPYSDPLLSTQGTVNGDGAVGWKWRCSDSDAKGTYHARITDDATHRRTGWVPFQVQALTAYTCRFHQDNGQLYAGISRTTTAVITLNSHNPDVAEAQCLLKHRGFNLGSQGIDGDYGSHTEQAVIAVQQQAHVLANGQIGPDTWKLLRRPSNGS